MNTTNTNTTVDSSSNLLAAVGNVATDETTAGEAAKRTRTSPRTKAFDEALKVIADQLATLGDEVDTSEALEVRTALEDVAAQIEVLRDSPQVPAGKPVAADALKMWVGVEMGTGVREVFLSHATPSKETHGKRYAMVAGPFLNASKAEKVRADGIGSTERRAF